jgi:hypothetical protein
MGENDRSNFHVIAGFFYMPQICFTSPPKEGMLRIWSPEKSDDLVPEGSMLITGPPKPLIFISTVIHSLVSTPLCGRPIKSSQFVSKPISSSLTA